MNDPNAKCGTCDNTWTWHHANNPQHPFNAGDMPASATFGKRRQDGRGNTRPPMVVQTTEPTLSPWPFDPVLRQALIDKGILTPEDLMNAERKIRSITATFSSGPMMGGTIVTTGDIPPSHQMTGMHVVNPSTGGSYTVGGQDGTESTA